MNKVQTAILELGATGNLNDIVDNYIANGLEDDRLLDPITNLLSRFELVKLLILSYKEKIITKPKNDTYKNTLLFTELESTACSIAKKLEDGRYEISGRIFEDANTVVAFVRNKIAHGDYVISDDLQEIILAPDGDQIHISFMDLEVFTIHLYLNVAQYRKTNEFSKLLTGNVKLPLLSNKINVKKIIDDFKLIKLTVKSNEELLSKDDYIVFNEVLQSILKYDIKINSFNEKGSLKKINDTIAELSKEAKEKTGFNSTITCTLDKLTEEEKKTVLDNASRINTVNLDLYQLIKEINLLAIRVREEKYNKEIPLSGALTFLQLLREACALRTSNLNKITDYIYTTYGSDIKSNLFKFGYDQIAITKIAIFVCLSYLFENFDENYYILDAKYIEPQVYKFVNNELIQLRQTITGKEKSLKEIEESISRLQSQIKGIRLSSMPVELKNEKTDYLNSIIKNNASKRRTLKEELKTLRTQAANCAMDRTYNKKHYYIKGILESIRNSISHGNFSITPNGDIEDTIITFKDYDKDELAFELNITIRQIKEMMSTVRIVQNDNKKRMIK